MLQSRKVWTALSFCISFCSVLFFFLLCLAALKSLYFGPHPQRNMIYSFVQWISCYESPQDQVLVPLLDWMPHCAVCCPPCQEAPYCYSINENIHRARIWRYIVQPAQHNTLAFPFTDEGPCSMKHTGCFSTWTIDINLYSWTRNIVQDTRS